MKSIAFALVSLAISAVSVAAFAHPTVASPRPVVAAHELTINIRLAKPHVLIVLQRPTAVAAAGAAHERMYDRLVASTQPSSH
jgi:hypothetical protein